MTYYRYRPNDKAHVTDDASTDGRTFCGLAHDGDVQEVGENPDDVLPKHIPYCQRCRATYVIRVMDSLDADVTALNEGDVIEYWTHDDPTKSNSSLCLRKEAVIVETPPWEMTVGRDETSTQTGSYRVQHDSITYASASPKRIWRVNHRPADDILSDSALEDALADALSTAYGVSND